MAHVDKEHYNAEALRITCPARENSQENFRMKCPFFIYINVCVTVAAFAKQQQSGKILVFVYLFGPYFYCRGISEKLS